jgi:hypothetical protein
MSEGVGPALKPRTDLRFRTRDTWSRQRRVVAKAG